MSGFRGGAPIRSFLRRTRPAAVLLITRETSMTQKWA